LAQYSNRLGNPIRFFAVGKATSLSALIILRLTEITAAADGRSYAILILRTWIFSGLTARVTTAGLIGEASGGMKLLIFTGKNEVFATIDTVE
jgi:hypothetical protein